MAPGGGDVDGPMAGAADVGFATLFERRGRRVELAGAVADTVLATRGFFEWASVPETKPNPHAVVNQIGPIVIGLVWRDGSLLVEEGYDSVKGQRFFRPPGGAIEFGEHAVDAVRREFREELNAELSDERLATVIENVFSYEGQLHHEVVFVFDAQFRDPGMYERADFEIPEPAVRTTASWKSWRELRAGDTPLYPEGLSEFLAGRR